MENTSNSRARPRDIAFFRQRLKNRIFSAIAEFFAEEAAAGRTTKKQIASFLDRDPSQITRWLTTPSNMTLDTVSDLLLALDAEPGNFVIERLSTKRKPNYAHPLVAEIINMHQPCDVVPQVDIHCYNSAGETRLKSSDGETAVWY